jgi:hypothetical protein
VAELTFSQLFQLYAPLAGLLVFAFFLGALANRVKTLERDGEEEQKRRASAGESARAELVAFARVAKSVEDMEKTIEKFGRELSGVNRQLANIATGRVNVSRELLEGD